MKSPSFQFYPTDYLGSQRVQMLTLEQEGAYIRLLSFCWQHGSIPKNPKEIARLVGKGCSTTLARVVSAMFQPSAEKRSRLVHERLQAEKIKQEAWRSKSSEGGKKSAFLKKKKSRVVDPPLEGSCNTPSSVFCLQSSTLTLKSKSIATLDEIKHFCIGHDLQESDAIFLFEKWNGNGWTNGGEKIKDWKATIRSWKAAGYMPSQKTQRQAPIHRKKVSHIPDAVLA